MWFWPTFLGSDSFWLGPEHLGLCVTFREGVCFLFCPGGWSSLQDPGLGARHRPRAVTPQANVLQSLVVTGAWLYHEVAPTPSTWFCLVPPVVGGGARGWSCPGCPCVPGDGPGEGLASHGKGFRSESCNVSMRLLGMHSPQVDVGPSERRPGCLWSG